MSPDWDEITARQLTNKDDRITELSAEIRKLRAERDEARADATRANQLMMDEQQCRMDAQLERDEERADARMWMDRYSSLFIRVSCGITLGTADIFYQWQCEVDEAYQLAALKGDAK